MTLNSNIFLFLRLMLLHLLILVNNLCVIVIITFFLKVELFFSKYSICSNLYSRLTLCELSVVVVTMYFHQLTTSWFLGLAFSSAFVAFSNSTSLHVRRKSISCETNQNKFLCILLEGSCQQWKAGEQALWFGFCTRRLMTRSSVARAKDKPESLHPG